MTKFVVGEPGRLTVDASHGLAAFPVPTETLVFSSEEAYYEFMAAAFNANVGYDPESGRQTLALRVVTLGIPYATNAQGDGLVPVSDPVDTFLGGPNGYYVVGDRVVCTDPTRCPVECAPIPAEAATLLDVQNAASYSLGNFSDPIAFSSDEVFRDFDGEPFMQASVGDAGILSASSMGLAAAPVEFKAVNQHWPLIGPNAYSSFPYYALEALVETKQVTGPLPYEIKLCSPPRIVTDSSGRKVTVPGACSTAISTPNELTLDVDYYSNDYNNSCKWEKIASDHVTKPNVPQITWNPKFTQTGGIYTNSGVKAFHHGRSPMYGVTQTFDTCWGAGCFTSDPCK